MFSRSPSAEGGLLLCLAVLQKNKERIKYYNIRPCKDSQDWQALLWLPGRRDSVVVGQHRQQVVAACMADDAAHAALKAGLSRQPDLNFDAVTRQMVSCISCSVWQCARVSTSAGAGLA